MCPTSLGSARLDPGFGRSTMPALRARGLGIICGIVIMDPVGVTRIRSFVRGGSGRLDRCGVMRRGVWGGGRMIRIVCSSVSGRGGGMERCC
ncbi:predicted protein [Plenodomus lingam JN3]|uniref:Predicted protein n=1 Tax=Leptosphaeria maculans (strain JN3 / isolate v23.1.3 / race Av1-4-5-6-7-8) TaxID=985895 RepID=E5A5J8_LEPMJ|nr:predicted protein [Plenodomus lingam JN3]CBX98896.1 predicted protein [Plenodomus lingam JN3]